MNGVLIGCIMFIEGWCEKWACSLEVLCSLDASVRETKDLLIGCISQPQSTEKVS